MPRLPRVTSRQVIRALTKAGFEVFDQSGSHVYLHRWQGDKWTERVTIPHHPRRTLKLKTLRNILRQANLSVEDFETLLRGR
ncbi:MAG TPA: type II toxin-antitoxin system HicA family toxin [Anaerolineae bacterium]|nr:type II toxin-antitoxin system HicA family toxin [Anaerolineae bacterium]